ncbi:MAG: transporter substrate-binding domain-containing protein [Pseudomonadota bacterium]
MSRVVLAAVLCLGIGGTAGAQTPCEPYTVVRGDTLNLIAQRAYGVGRHQLIYEANVETIGRNLNAIEVGMVLNIPCRDGSLGPNIAVSPVTHETIAQGIEPPAADPTSPPPAPDRIAAPWVPGPEIRILTAGNDGPLADEGLPGGGLIAELVRAALRQAAPGQRFRIDFVDDREAHLSVLLPSTAFDLSFPWFGPNCGQPGRLSAEMRQRCADFAFSNPLYEVQMGLYARADGPYVGAADMGALAGARICRPAGFAVFDLEEAGLVSADTAMLRPATAADCFRALAAGDVDIVSVNSLAGDTALAGGDGALARLAGLGTRQTLHVVTSRSNPRGAAYLALLNRGLQEIGASGEWFRIVSRSLSAQPAGVD